MPTTLIASALLCAAAGTASDRVPGLDHAALPILSLDLKPRFGLISEIQPTPSMVLSGVQAGGADPELDGSADEVRLRGLRHWERVLKWGTAGSLVVTSTLGTLAALNQPTVFADGRCLTGNPIFGNYGCDRGLSTLHGASGVLSATLYTANGVLALTLPGPVGNVSPAERPWHRALTYVHLGGIVIQPILGLVSAFPQVIGLHNTAPTDTFPRDGRTAHLMIGYLTTAAYLATLALEL